MRRLPDSLLAKSQSMRKKATVCIGAFAIVLSGAQLENLVKLLSDRIVSSQNQAETLTLIQCIGHMSRTVGQKLGPYLGRLYPVLEKKMSILSPETSTNIDNEIVEATLNTMENLVKRCPKEVTQFTENIMKWSMRLLEYDPNYTYDDNAGDEAMDDDDEDGGWGDYGEDVAGGDDDDDTSWKVRSAAAKAIEALIKSRPELLKQFYESHAMALVSRIKERDDNVKIAILVTLSALLRSTILSESAQTVDMELR